MTALDASIVNISLPSIARTFHTQVDGSVQWVIIAYLVVVAATLMTFGRLADLAGRKPVWMAGFVVFTLGSIFCGAAGSVRELVGARIFQGLGGALIFAPAFAIITDTFSSSQRGRALGLNAVVFAVATSLGPALGGLITGHLAWRWIFYVNVPVGVIGLLASQHVLPASSSRAREPLDIRGAALLAVGFACITLTLSFSQEWGVTRLLTCLVLGLIALAGAVLVERRSRYPIVDLSLFREPALASALTSMTVAMLALFAVGFMLPFYFEELRGFSVMESGLLLTPLPLAIGLVAPVSGALADRLGSRWLTSGGLALACVGLLLLARLDQASTVGDIVWRLALIGLGQGVFQAPNVRALMNAAPRGETGEASSLYATGRVVGQSLSVALAGAVFTGLGGAAAGHALAAGGSSAASTADIAGVQQAFLTGFRGALLVCAAVAAVGVVVAFARGNERAARRVAKPAGEEAGSLLDHPAASRDAVRARRQPAGLCAEQLQQAPGGSQPICGSRLARGGGRDRAQRRGAPQGPDDDFVQAGSLEGPPGEDDPMPSTDSRPRRALRAALVIIASLLVTGLGLVALGQTTDADGDLPVVRGHDGVTAVRLTAITDKNGRSVLAFEGRAIPPVLHVAPGSTLRVRYDNQLSALSGERCAQGPCQNMTNLHFHGLHVSPLAPQDDVLGMSAMPGETLEYVVSVPRDHAPGLYWYHTHPHGESHRQALDGMSGAIVVDGIERYVPEVANVRERILVLRARDIEHDPQAAALKRRVVMPSGRCGAGDGAPERLFTMNGAIRPTLTMAPGERQFWRIVNAAADQYADLQIPGGWWQVVALDGMPLAYHDPGRRPLPMEHVLLPPGGRLEAIVTGPPAGRRTVLKTRCVDTGPGGDANPEMIIADVVSGWLPATAASSSAVLPAVAPATPVERSTAVTDLQASAPQFVVRFTEDSKGFYINDRAFALTAPPLLRVRIGSYQHWRVVNHTHEIHPFHIHQTHFLAYAENDVRRIIPLWLDTVNVPAGGSVDLIMDFTDPVIRGMSVLHCHLLNHEDKGMMAKILFE